MIISRKEAVTDVSLLAKRVDDRKDRDREEAPRKSVVDEKVTAAEDAPAAPVEDAPETPVKDAGSAEEGASAE